MGESKTIAAALSLFNEKAEKLESLSFTRQIEEEKQTLKLSFRNESEGLMKFSSNRVGPSPESVDAFVLTFRFFIQNNEVSSFGNLAKLYDDSSLPEDFRKEFAEVRRMINDHLDGYPEFGIVAGKKSFSRREILETFVYGGLSHANPDKYKQFKRFQKSAPIYSLAEWEFILILSRIFVAIRWIKELNKKALVALN